MTSVACSLGHGPHTWPLCSLSWPSWGQPSSTGCCSPTSSSAPCPSSTPASSTRTRLSRSAVTYWIMHAQYFALINLNLKLLICVWYWKLWHIMYKFQNWSSLNYSAGQGNFSYIKQISFFLLLILLGCRAASTALRTRHPASSRATPQFLVTRALTRSGTSTPLCLCSWSLSCSRW